MTNVEINNAIHRYRGVKNFRGDLHSLSAVCYFFLLDASYQVFDKKIKPLPFKHQDKKLVGRIKQAYNDFFDRFFAAFSQEERDYLIDKADEMEAFLEHHIEVARMQMLNCCIDYPVEVQEQIADLWLCNRLAYEAMSHYAATWKKGGFKLYGAVYTKQDRNKQLEVIVQQTKNLSKSLFGDEDDVKEKYLAQIHLSMSILTKKICEWVSEDYRREVNGIA